MARPVRGKIVLNSGKGPKVIESNTPTLGDPTHGVVVGDIFYYIANSGWSELDDHGDLKPGAKLTAARIMQFKLR